MISASGGSLAAPPGGIAAHPRSRRPAQGSLDLTVLVQDADERGQLAVLLPQLVALLDRLGIAYEVCLLVRDAGARMEEAAAAHGARVVVVSAGYGAALTTGFANAAGDYILTMDADLSHPPDFIERLWAEREEADVTIASRYVPGGAADMGIARYACSRVLNAVFSRGLDVPIRDLSSGFRLYRADVIREQHLTSRDLDILQQIVVQAFAEGWRVREVPFRYRPSKTGESHRRVVRVGWRLLETFGELWMLRNSILAADYDNRAHDSRIPLQRYWQRMRHRHVMNLVSGEGPVLDVGCGSSRIIAGLPPGSVAVDVLQRKLRYARRFKKPLVRGSGFALPFANGSFPCVLCSQVIEHVPKDSPILDELCRVLAPGGRLVLGTPDYGNWQWVYIEKLYGLVPGGYKDEHISHYTNDELVRVMSQRGLRFEEERYILRGELIQAYRKPALA
jgi:SAM-dependent methyltransferase